MILRCVLNKIGFVCTQLTHSYVRSLYILAMRRKAMARRLINTESFRVFPSRLIIRTFPILARIFMILVLVPCSACVEDLCVHLI